MTTTINDQNGPHLNPIQGNGEELAKQREEVPAQEAPPPPPKPKGEVTLIPIGADGKVVARNNSELLRYCAAMVLGGGVPRRFDSPQKLFAALMLVRDLKLPDTAVRQVADIHGTPSIFGDLPLALVQRGGELTHFEEQWFDEAYNPICFENKNLNANVWGAVCFAARAGGKVQSFSFTMDDAERAGLYPARKRDGSPANDSPWMKYTRIMLRYKARSIALKSLFADSINGLAIAEYDFDALPDATGAVEAKDVTPKSTTDLRAAFRTQLEENA